MLGGHGLSGRGPKVRHSWAAGGGAAAAVPHSEGPRPPPWSAPAAGQRETTAGPCPSLQRCQIPNLSGGWLGEHSGLNFGSTRPPRTFSPSSLLPPPLVGSGPAPAFPISPFPSFSSSPPPSSLCLSLSPSSSSSSLLLFVLCVRAWFDRLRGARGATVLAVGATRAASAWVSFAFYILVLSSLGRAGHVFGRLNGSLVTISWVRTSFQRRLSSPPL